MSAISSKVGASAVTKASEVNPRELLLRIMESSPSATKEVLFDEFRSEIGLDDRFRRTVDWYFFINMYEYAVTSRNKNPAAEFMQRRQAQVEASVHTHELVKSIKSQIVLLDLIMPNEKTMKDCTGSDMARFGNRYQKIAERVGKTKTVGEVLSEDDVRRVMA